jgi:hypothetical protein
MPLWAREVTILVTSSNGLPEHPCVTAASLIFIVRVIQVWLNSFLLHIQGRFNRLEAASWKRKHGDLSLWLS